MWGFASCLWPVSQLTDHSSDWMFFLSKTEQNIVTVILIGIPSDKLIMNVKKKKRRMTQLCCLMRSSVTTVGKRGREISPSCFYSQLIVPPSSAPPLFSWLTGSGRASVFNNDVSQTGQPDKMLTTPYILILSFLLSLCFRYFPRFKVSRFSHMFFVTADVFPVVSERGITEWGVSV